MKLSIVDMSETRIKVGLVGCGQIADAHLQQIRRIPWADIVAVCDLEPLLARQAAERFDVPGQFTDVDDMLRCSTPDVVHLTTPVASHCPLAVKLLQSGVHVYVEKPLTLDTTEALQVVNAAEENNTLVCLGHDQLFDPVWLEAQRRIDAGEIGEVRHVDSALGYPIRGAFGSQVIANPDHWVRKLPGGLFQNTISHPLYRITELLPDEDPEVHATWFSQLSDVDFPTELRASIRGRRVTGSLVFKSTAKPCERLTRIYGTEGGLEIDLNTQLIRTFRDSSLPGALGRLEAPFRQWRESARNLTRSLGKFWGGNFHYFEGMKGMFLQFYEAIQEGGEAPVPNCEIIRVSRLMDRIFAECRADEQRRAGACSHERTDVVTDQRAETATGGLCVAGTAN